MKPRRSTAIWEAGTHLSDAWRRFGNEERREAFANMPGALDTAAAEMQDIASKPSASVLQTFLEAMQSGNRQWQRKSEIVRQMQSELLDEIFNEQLLATGYRVAPALSRYPVIIETALFDDVEVDWANSVVRGLGQEFRNVRITDPADRSIQVSDKRRGRPGSGEAIAAAIERVALRPNFCTENRMVAAQWVRDELGEEHCRGNGLSNENLAKYIRAKCGNKLISK